MLSNDDEADGDEDVDDEQDSGVKVQPYTAADDDDSTVGAAARVSGSVPHMAANGDAAAHGSQWQHLTSSSQQQQAEQPQKHWQNHLGDESEDMDGS